MSIKALTAVWNGSRANGHALLVALAIADGVRPEYGKPVCFAPTCVLARKTGLSEQQVEQALAVLKAEGELGTQHMHLLCVGHAE